MRALAFLIVLLVVGGGSASAAPSGQAAPPHGLTGYGRVVWNLDALLHDKFGNRQVYLNYGPNGQESYSADFLDMARSTPYTYTFSNAHHSQFHALVPRRSPKIGVYAVGRNVPIRMGHAYISCGNGKWLYERSGQSMFGGDIWCSKSPLHP